MGQQVDAEETTRTPVDCIAHAVDSRHFADTLSNAHSDQGSKFIFTNGASHVCLHCCEEVASLASQNGCMLQVLQV